MDIHDKILSNYPYFVANFWTYILLIYTMTWSNMGRWFYLLFSFIMWRGKHLHQKQALKNKHNSNNFQPKVFKMVVI